MISRMGYLLSNWKIGIHLIFRTKRFGVNNRWWNEFDSIFGLSFYKRFSILKQYSLMKFRAGACHFLSDESFKFVFGDSK